MNPDKNEIRDEMRQVLKNLDQRWLRAASGELCTSLTALLSEKAERPIEHVLAWTSFFAGEPDLSRFISDELERRGVYLPRTAADFSMLFIAIGADWATQVEPGHFGIPEPCVQSGEVYNFDSAARSVILVPGLAFDRSGNRLGRGQGCYDRFLSAPELHSVLKGGVCWEMQLTEDIPVEEHDIAMDWICTEESMTRCSFIEGEL